MAHTLKVHVRHAGKELRQEYTPIMLSAIDKEPAHRIKFDIANAMGHLWPFPSLYEVVMEYGDVSVSRNMTRLTTLDIAHLYEAINGLANTHYGVPITE